MKKSGKQLNDVGIIWDRLEICLLFLFKSKNGKGIVIPVRREEIGIRVGNLLSKQRTTNSQGKLHSMHQQQLILELFGTY